MTTLHFYQGLRTIGGTVVEIATEDARCLFDFGFDGSSEIDRRVKLRENAIVSDFLKTGCLPWVAGLYDRTHLKDLPLAAFGETGIRPFVLISHMHIDHMGALGMLAEDADVYMSGESLLLYQGLVKTGDVLFRAHKSVIGVKPTEWVTRGSIAFRMIPVDHDVLGACGFEIITPDGRICYTGDLRLHGFCGEDTLRFATLAHGADVCITEGVTVSFIDDFDSVMPDYSLSSAKTEKDAVEEITEAAFHAPGLVFLNIYNRNLVRLKALQESLHNAGRQLVLEPDTACLFSHCCEVGPLYVYMPSGGPCPLADAICVTREDIQFSPDRYVLQLSYENLLETLDFAPETSLYIHSNGVPLGAYDPSFQRLQGYLLQQGISYQPIGCSGHAEPAHLKYILETIGAKTLVPLHSLTPEKIRIAGSKQVLPEPGDCFCLSNGDLLKKDAAELR